MSLSFEPWLPLDVAARPAVRAAIDETVGAWCAHWFGDYRMRVARLEPFRGGLEEAMGGEARLLKGECLRVSCGDRAIVRLVQRALDVDPLGATPTEADRKIIEAVGADLLQDLIARSELALGCKRSPGASGGGARAGLADAAGDVLVWLGLPFASLQPVCTASLPAPRRPTKLGRSRLQAVGGQPVQLEAVLGAADLTLADLRSLAPGDVLVLDRALHDPALITLKNSDAVVARGTIAEAGTRLGLALTADRSGEQA